MLLILGCHMVHEALSLMMRHQVDRCACEAAPGEARPKAPWMGASQFNQYIEFASAVLEKITGTFVALEHELAKLTMVIFTQGAFSEYNPLDFPNHMMSAFKFALRQ